jgi:multiple sugar transport system ATP-binding protein
VKAILFSPIKENTMAEVLLKNLGKKFEEVVAVNNFNLEIADQEFVVLVGPSGCGKTTTLRMIAGLEDITEGEIYIGGKLVNDLAPKDRNIAMVFQSYALYPHMNVADNMAFGLRMRKVPKQERWQRVNHAAQILGIQELLSRKPRQLSGGQRQRVALGRTIVRNPEVFLFDEPLSNLDAKLRGQMRTELKKLHERIKATVVYVTHDQVEAMTMGDRIVVMKDGIVQQIGAAIELYKKPENLFVAGFIGSPTMNFIQCVILEESSVLYADTGDFKLQLPDSISSEIRSEKNRELILGIRPEDILEKAAPQESTIDNTSFKAMINVVEPLGKEIALEVTSGANSLVVLLGTDKELKPHKDIDLRVNMDKMHLFQKDSGKAII